MCLGHITQLVFIEVKKENTIWFMIFQSKSIEKNRKKVLMLLWIKVSVKSKRRKNILTNNVKYIKK